MSSNTAALPAPLTRDETRSLFGQTMGLVAYDAGTLLATLERAKA